MSWSSIKLLEAARHYHHSIQFNETRTNNIHFKSTLIEPIIFSFGFSWDFVSNNLTPPSPPRHWQVGPFMGKICRTHARLGAGSTRLGVSSITPVTENFPIKSCLLITLIMSQWPQVSRIALCMAKVKVTQWLSDSVSEWVTRSPIELIWTAKNTKHKTPHFEQLLLFKIH